MLRAASIRLLSAAVTLLIASFIIFTALHYSPGSSVAFILGGSQNTATPEQIAFIEQQYGLNDPLLTRYGTWLLHALSGDWGQSYSMRENVWTVIASRLPTTFGLIALASLFSISLGMVIGIISSIGGRFVSMALSILTTIGFATPGFVASIVLVTFFAVRLNWFPALGSGEGFADGLWHLILPSIALGLTTCCIVARITRVSVSDEMRREHVQTAIIRGVPSHLVLIRHVLRNALIPIVTIAGISMATMVAGTVVIEFAFGLHGVGTLLIAAVQQKDVPIVQAVSTLLVGTYLLVNFVVDLLYIAIDPRVRLESR